jgi:hypothetical protein
MRRSERTRFSSASDDEAADSKGDPQRAERAIERSERSEQLNAASGASN